MKDIIGNINNNLEIPYKLLMKVAIQLIIMLIRMHNVSSYATII